MQIEGWSRQGRTIVVITLGIVALSGALAISTPWLVLSVVDSLLAKAYTESRPFPYRLPDKGYYPVRAERENKLAVVSRAVEILRASEYLLSGNARWHQLLGRAALLDRDPDAAVKEYETAVELRPHDQAIRIECAGALLTRGQSQGRSADLALALQEFGEATGLAPLDASASFNLALIYEAIPAPAIALSEWTRSLQLETDSRWRTEALTHESRLRKLLEERKRRFIAMRQGPTSYVEESITRPYPADVVLDEAITNWLPNLDRGGSARKALELLNRQMVEKHQDYWLQEILKTPAGMDRQAGLQALADTLRANAEGNHEKAIQLSQVAIAVFRRIGCRAGIARARLALVYALHRSQKTTECMLKVQSLIDELAPTHYYWLMAQSRLELTTCQSKRSESGHLVADREATLSWIRQTRFEDLQLRALGFLVEPELVRANPLRLWRLAHEGLDVFWRGECSPVRAQQIYMAVALSAKSAFPFAAVAMAREGVRIMDEIPDLQWRALCISALASMESATLLNDDAAQHFQEAEFLFAKCATSALIERYRFYALLEWAQSEVQAGRPVAAASKLSALQHEFEEIAHDEPLVPYEQVLGRALLDAGMTEKARTRFEHVLDRTRRMLLKVVDRSQRYALITSAETAFRGQIQIKLTVDRDYTAALQLWNEMQSSADPTPSSARSIPSDVAQLTVLKVGNGYTILAADDLGVEGAWVKREDLPLEMLARDFTSLCATPASAPAEIQKAGRALYEGVLRPFEKRLSRHHVLAINGDGIFGALPWGAIADPAGRPLIERYAVLVGKPQRSNGHPTPPKLTRRPLVIAAPAIAREFAPAYSPLPEALKEAAGISRIWPDARILSGGEAKIDVVKGFLPQTTFFHFGGHGTVHGGYGAILLAAGEGATHRGVLDADEIASLDLRGVRVVSLATCSAGVGQSKGVLNPEGLVRALLDAGVQNVIASTWRVDSTVSAKLFVEFYRELKSGYSVQNSLARAIEKIRRGRETSHPYFWAAFQNYGRPD